MKNIFIIIFCTLIGITFISCSSKEDFKPLYQSKPTITKVKV